MKADKIGKGYNRTTESESQTVRSKINLTPFQRGLIHAGLTIAVFCAANKIGGAIRNKIGGIFR